MPVHPPGWRSSGCARAKASGPLTRITPIPPVPGGVAIAAIVSFCIVGLYTRGSTSLFLWYFSAFLVAFIALLFSPEAGGQTVGARAPGTQHHQCHPGGLWARHRIDATRCHAEIR